MTTLDYAKAYIDFGWSLIPIVPETKKPAVKWLEYCDRRATLEEVTKWINSGWYLAVVTGPISGVLVVDDDRVKNGLTEWGFTSPVEAKSESGGKHYYFKYDREIHSHSNTQIHIDLKAWHSYCLLPPFKNRVWTSKPSENLAKLTPLSDDIVRLIRSDMQQPEQRKALNMEDFVNIPNGARTENLHRIACSIFTKMNKDDGLRVLAGVNQTYLPPLDEKEFTYQVSRAWDFVQSSKSNKPIEKIEANQESYKVYSGFPTVDAVLHGFRSSNAFLVGGYEKSGKSSLLAKIANNMIRSGVKVGVIHTELTNDEVNTMFACVDKKLDRYTVEDNDKGAGWRSEVSPYFECSDQRSLMVDDGDISFDLAIEKGKDFVAKGCKVLIFDNLTTFYNQTSKQDNWKVLGSCIQKIINFSKLYNIVSFVVVHQRPDSVYSEMPKNIVTMLQNNQEDEIFSKSLSVIEKPTNSKIYGGGGAHSQLSGSLLLWRPLQNHNSTKFSSMSALVLENFRHAPSRSIKMTFTGAKSDFTEDPQEIINYKQETGYVEPVTSSRQVGIKEDDEFPF